MFQQKREERGWQDHFSLPRGAKHVRHKKRSRGFVKKSLEHWNIGTN
jgi:hypothetical protein